LEMDITLDRQHSFTKVKIPNLGNDAKDRKEFSADQIQIIRDMPLSKTPEITHLIQLMLDTGMRVSECCGLMVKDIKLEAETPFLEIYRNNVRDLKTKNSRRLIPLVGSSLSAMQQAVDNALGVFIFSRYVDEAEGKVKNDNASAACKKRLIALLGEGAPTAHSFRHSLQTRLRNVECPKELRNELGGWAKDISDRYGSPSDLTLKAKYLLATV
jgi:integrase